MRRGDSPPEPALAGARGPGERSLRLVVFGVLIVLSAWGVLYELGCTLFPGLLKTFLIAGVAPDIAFALGGLLLIARSIRAERAWGLIGLGALCWAAGDVYWQLNLANLSSPPVPSWADAGYLSFCPLTFVGILLLVRKRASGAPKAMVADALAASLAVGALSAAVVVHPVLTHATGGTLAIATNLAYPLVDLALLGLIVGATALDGWRLQRAWVLLGLSVVSFWIADSVYLIKVATNTYAQSEWFNPLWYWSPIIAAWAGWLPREAPGAVVEHQGRRGIVISLAFACLALGTLVWSSFSSVGAIAIVLATMSIQVIMLRLLLTWRENAELLRTSREEALTDALTGLANRRALALELDRRMTRGDAQPPYVLALFDLDGFKHYNDSFGHPTGDALLQRLGCKLRDQLEGKGSAYRMGGDEFCALIDVTAEDVPREGAGVEAIVEASAAALTEHGDGFTIGCSYGTIVLPSEADSAEAALRLADQRMYAQKRGDRASASRQSADVLLRALTERNLELGSHLRDVAALARAVARRFGLPQEEVDNIRQAAELHDLGKVAVPDAILFKPGPLNESEWEFIRRHTLIGERIAGAAPALRRVATLVRSTHENVDGSGYPDGLAGEQIPLGSRIIHVCDAFDAMTTDRAYCAAMDELDALAELRRCAGTQFDADVVEHFCAVVAETQPAQQAA